MKKKCLSNSRLYITEDMNHDNVWFAKTDCDFIARLELTDMWNVYLYNYKFTFHKNSLKECLRIIEKVFKRFWSEKYADRRI